MAYPSRSTSSKLGPRTRGQRSLCLGARSNGSTSTLALKPPATSSSAASAPTGTILDNGEPMPKTAKDLPWVSKTSALEHAFTKSKGKPIEQHSSFHVTYDDTELTRIQAGLVGLVDPLVSLPRTIPVRGDAMHAYMMELLIYHSMNVIRAVMFFKHEAYRNEKEYRFQQLFRRDRPAPAVKYRRRGSSLVRYREFDWRKLAPGSLKRIVIGPAADRTKTTRFAKDCLTAFHPQPDKVELVYSKISRFRSPVPRASPQGRP